VNIEYNPSVEEDLADIVEYYSTKAGLHLATRFTREYEDIIQSLKHNPERFSPYLGHKELRRVKFPSFPYLVIFRPILGGVRVTVVKHARSHPRRGIRRK
jgi:plasmid stabilization system protein ParE